MARGSQTFSVSLSLLTKNFQKGVKTVQTSLNNLKMQFRNFAGALGAGLGISEIARNMIDSARKLDKAQAVLRNVSNGVHAYGENQQFVMDLSKKYNQELTTLMSNYAKYHATANQANIALEEQKYIYEALTRASAYFNLSADETNGVMLAITQMMSKGRVSSEELRRQLGERLPGAMGIMAKAMGVTNAELENMLKRGQLMAVDALPKFAKELNKITQNINVDNIEGATNKLRNAFTNLTTKLNVGGMYKSILNGVSNGLEYITENLRQVKNAIITTFAALAGGNMFNKVKSNYLAYYQGLKTELDTYERQFQKHSDRIMQYASQRDKYMFAFGKNMEIESVIPVKPISDAKEWERLNKDVAKYNELLNNSSKTQGLFTNKFSYFGRAAKSVGIALKSLAASFAPMLIIGAVTSIIQKFIEWRKEVQRVKNLVKETMDELDTRINKLSSEEVELNLLKVTAFDTQSYDEDRKGIINRLNEMLGTDFTIKTTNFEINKAINERLNLLKQEKKYQETIAEIADQKNEKEKKLKEIQKLQSENLKLQSKLGTAPTQDVKMQWASKINSNNRQIKLMQDEVGEITKLIEILESNNQELAKTASDRQKILEDVNIGNQDTDNDTVDIQYKKIQEEYNNSLRALDDKLKDGVITQDEYDKSLKELTLSTMDSIYALNDIDENSDAFASMIRDAAIAYQKTEEKEDKVQEALDKYYESVQELFNQYNNGVITHEQLSEEMYNLLEETVKAIAAMGDLSGAAEKLARQFDKDKKDKANATAKKIPDPELGERDATFDYKKEASEILGEKADAFRSYEEDLKNTIKELEGLESTEEIQDRLEGLRKKLEETTADAESFEEAMKLATVSEDIKNLENELAQGVWDNFKNIADAADRLTNAVKSCIETMEDPDASEWEKILTIFNAITQTVDTIMQSVELINTLTQVMDKLKAAEQSYQAIQDANATKDLSNAAASVIASQAEATGSGTAEAAKMPFPYNLLAIAAVVGTVASVFASLPKFAGGGIIQGNSKIGDHNLARVNAGEMILNPQQQATLFNMLNGSNSGMSGRNGGGNVEFKIRGSELVGVLKNHYNRLKG